MQHTEENISGVVERLHAFDQQGWIEFVDSIINNTVSCHDWQPLLSGCGSKDAVIPSLELKKVYQILVKHKFERLLLFEVALEYHYHFKKTKDNADALQTIIDTCASIKLAKVLNIFIEDYLKEELKEFKSSTGWNLHELLGRAIGVMERLTIEAGFYRRYKHVPSDPPGVNIIEVLGITYDTEGDGDLNSRAKVLYRPMDKEMKVFKEARRTEFKSYAVFTSTVEWEGQMVPRYQKIEDPSLITVLEKIRFDLYAHALVPKGFTL